MANKQTRELRKLPGKRIHEVTFFTRTIYNAKGKKHAVEIVEHAQGRTAFEPSRAALKNKQRYQTKKPMRPRTFNSVTSLIG